MIFLASFVNKKSEWKLTRFDLTCGTLSLLGLALWLITKEGNVAIFFSIVADGLAAVPTIVKAYRYPETEIGWVWLTVVDWTFAHYGFPLYIILVNLIIYMLVQFKLGKRLSVISP